MAVTLVTTLADALSNSYVDITYCDEYWAFHYDTTKADLWTDLTAVQKLMALLHACRSIETLRFTVRPVDSGVYSYEYNFHSGLVEELTRQDRPMRSDQDQALQFPRNLDYDVNGDLFIPEPIKIAQCEQAVYLLSLDDSAIVNRNLGIEEESVTVGNVSIRQRFSTASTTMSPIALEMVRPFLIKTSSSLRRG